MENNYNIQNLTGQIQQLQSLLSQKPNYGYPASASIQQSTVTTTAPIQAVPFVSGVKGMKDYAAHMGANSSAAVFDETGDKFYFLKTDANGNLGQIMVGNYTLEPLQEETSEFVTKKDFDALRNDIQMVVAKLAELDKPRPQQNYNQQRKNGGSNEQSS